MFIDCYDTDDHVKEILEAVENLELTMWFLDHFGDHMNAEVLEEVCFGPGSSP